MEILVDIELVGVHPLNESIRGVNPSLTGLTESVRQSGQAYALGAVPDGRGGYLVYEGARRLAAMTAAAMTQVRLSVENLTDEQILERIAASDIKEPLPHAVVDRWGVVVGGRSWLVRQMLDAGQSKHSIATSLNVTLDEVSGYLALHSEEQSVTNAVAKGSLPFSAYCRVKYKSAEFKEKLVEPATRGRKVTVRNVLKAIEDDNPISGRRTEAAAAAVETSKVNPISVLLRIRADLTTLQGMGYRASGEEVWDDIVDMVNTFNEGNGGNNGDWQ